METFETNEQSNDQIVINDEIKAYLLESTKWAKFLSILGFVGLGLMVLALILMKIGDSSFNSYSYGRGSLSSIVIVYILLAYFPINYFYKFSIGIKQGINSNDQESFTSGLRNLKSHYKFIGIFTIIIISINILSLISILMINW